MKRQTLVFIGLLTVLTLLNISQPAGAGTLPSILNWTNPDTVDKVQIEKAASLTGAFTMLAQIPASTITYLDATNGPGETACYRVAYFTTSGVGPYAGPVCKTFPALPSQAPGALTVN